MTWQFWLIVGISVLVGNILGQLTYAWFKKRRSRWEGK